MPRYKSRVSKKRGGAVASGGSIRSGGGSGSLKVSAEAQLPDYKHLSSHLHAAHAALNVPRKTWRLVQHAAALHAGDGGSPLFPGVTAEKIARMGLDYAVAPKGAYRDIVRGGREAVAQGLLSEMGDHMRGHYKGAGLAKALSNAFKTVHGFGKKAGKHGKAFAKKVPGYWKKMKGGLEKADHMVGHAGNVMDAVHTGFSEAAQQYSDAGLAGSEYLKEEIMPGAHDWYSGVKGIQEAARGVTEGAMAQVQGVEDVAAAAVNPVRQAIDEQDLFA